MAVHAPDALKILGHQVTHDEARVLGAFQYAYRYKIPDASEYSFSNQYILYQGFCISLSAVFPSKSSVE